MSYVEDFTETSSVIATAYVDEVTPVVPVVASQAATSVVQWGLVSVAIAFSNAITPTTQRPSAQTAYSTVAYGVTVGRNLIPIEATAVVQQSNTPTPPSPPGSQLSFYWG